VSDSSIGEADFGQVLKGWRARRKLSQVELSGLADISARHISFLEKGRSKPSRDMVHRLARTLSIAPIEVNTALVAAGYAPLFPKAKLDSDNVKTLTVAVNALIEKQMPWPAIACNAHWDLIHANPAAVHLLHLMGAGESKNVMQTMLASCDPEGPIVNWPQIARLMLDRLSTELINDPTNATLQGVRAQLASHPRIHEDKLVDESELQVAVPIVIRTNGVELSFISMIAQFGAVQEITFSGVHVELFFPNDAATTRYLQDLESGNTSM